MKLLLSFCMILVPFLLPCQEADLLVSPGKLSKVHAHLSGIKNCNQCHTAGKKTDPLKCLACHKDLAERINAGKGYHRDKKTGCITCHPEHHGEEFQLILWDVKKFDHAETGYTLTGLHRKVTDCDRCHTGANAVPGKKAKTYLLKDARCAACHRDVHQGQLGKACDKCHGLDTPFKQIAFNHDKTSFPLKGGHSRVECGKCHKEKKWTGLRFADCTDCHRDPHQPPFKKTCRSCHNENSWRVSTFDHDQTRYPLRGKHGALSCEKCHPTGKKSKKMPFSNCRDCHKTDPHQGQFESDCKACHVVAAFKNITYNHDTSRYPLTGKHRTVSCRKCHYARETSKTVIYKPLGTNCSDCHKDIHLEQFNKRCEDCHNTKGFKREFLEFDHQADSTYPLQGKHAQTACEKCHLAKKQDFPAGFGEAVLYRPISSKCTTCHEDYHQGQLDSDCRKCHGLDSFKPAPGFDHQNTKFSLKIFHETVKCLDCHPLIRTTAAGVIKETVKYKSVGTTCLDCHRTFDHSKTAFALTGKHRQVDCRYCHNEKTPHTRRMRRTPSGMFECRHCHVSPHPGNQPDCAGCHTTKSWRVDPW
jgi:hypothetical protein